MSGAAAGRPASGPDRGLWVQCACTLLVALGAAFASYRHGQAFALRFGADPTTAAIWPLIVDGLLTAAAVELWRPGRGGGLPAAGDAARGRAAQPRPQHHRTETTETAEIVPRAAARREPTAEERMWVYYQAQRTRGRTPTGADLDRIAGTKSH